jgi:hypothetical protein
LNLVGLTISCATFHGRLPFRPFCHGQWKEVRIYIERWPRPLCKRVLSYKPLANVIGLLMSGARDSSGCHVFVSFAPISSLVGIEQPTLTKLESGAESWHIHASSRHLNRPRDATARMNPAASAELLPVFATTTHRIT